eukprot:TRINITY_DN24384_c0_g1_i1.p1 TRINITY_DN24384_c0_g1~~TRINITY_DN24384_c0_g1_i1.p1  ORF type:complete len:399 (+),score=94.14 TRINITY_DN24384_c0_g1_i1:138-1334(+)
MKKFWHSGQLNISAGGGVQGQEEDPQFLDRIPYRLHPHGNVNLVYEDEQRERRPSNLEAIEEEGESTLSFSEEDEEVVETAGGGFTVSPTHGLDREDEVDHLPEDEPEKDYDDDEDEDEEGSPSGSDDEDAARVESSFADGYDILVPPTAAISRSRLLPHLLSKLEEVEDVCTDPTCPYNLWLYEGDAPFPDDSDLAWFEHSRSGDDLMKSGNSILDTSRRPGHLNPSLESTRIPHNVSNSFDQPTSSRTGSMGPPPPYTSQTSSKDNSSYGLSSSTYPIITLPKSARPKSGLAGCLSPQTSSAVLRPVSACSCETSSSTTTCSTCIPEPDDPNAPHAFVVQDGKARPKRKSKYWPTCDTACCATFSFIVFCLIGLACLLLYIYFNTKVMHQGMTEYR